MKTYHHSFLAMGTRMDILIPGIDQGKGEHVCNLIQTEVLRLEWLYSRFNAEGEIGNLNATGNKMPVRVSAELFLMLQNCLRWHENTDGYFNICLGSMSAALKKKPRLNADERKKLLNESGMDKLQLDASNNSVFLNGPSVKLDFGSVGKGIALSHIHRILQRDAIDNALVNFGNSSVLAHGNHPFGETWAVGIQQLDNPDTMAHIFYLKDQSLSTSGVTWQNSGTGDEISGHILNPHTGMPVNHIGTLSVVSVDPVEAEVLSTALYCAPKEMHEEILSRFKPAEIKEL